MSPKLYHRPPSVSINIFPHLFIIYWNKPPISHHFLSYFLCWRAVIAFYRLSLFVIMLLGILLGYYIFLFWTFIFYCEYMLEIKVNLNIVKKKWHFAVFPPFSFIQFSYSTLLHVLFLVLSSLTAIFFSQFMQNFKLHFEFLSYMSIFYSIVLLLTLFKS